ncbi:MAG: ABC transporter ATP-binding protein [Oscillospiraceae bacterium]|nr:ABC transporter ATP-binding protein [Oscillospiraceae bacterium]
MLQIKNLSVNYGHIRALVDLSLEVNEGEIITLIGGNGAGKTTTLAAVSNLIDKTDGTITYKGQDITWLAPEKIVRLGIAHVPEGRKIFPNMTVLQNLQVGAMGNPKMKKPEIAAMIERSYSLFPRLKERQKQMGGSLSGGEQQMLAIARGLMMDPDLLLLDEPSLGLAPIIVEDIFELIVEVRKTGKTILLIEQNASMALSIADRGYVLETGSITLEGTGQELIKSPEVIKAYLGG